MMKVTALFPVLLLLTLWGCNTSKQITKTSVSAKAEKNEVVIRDTVEILPNITDPEEPYQATYTRRNDLLHTQLEVSFDWSKKHLLGKANLRLKPVFYPTDSLELDAKGFDIKEVAMVNGKSKAPLQYTYDGRYLKIQLDRSYKRTEEYTIFIDYTAKPDELPAGGSAAITSEKGLYFINPDGSDPDKPRQIWTQGETESSSCWFPTIDHPNERTTQELSMTVEDKYKTLSNGLLASSIKNPNGTRTDTWKMDLPHAPYLFMMAVGEFAVVEDTWRGKPLYYMVEPAYAADAKLIYNHTPEMLTFFSDKLGVEYPWSKFAQIIVRDYVSGAMENTTAVIFGEFCQKTARELIDAPNDGIVAHEMFHHWFGDLVTCESWSNLTLNESFANYSEYLWYEHKYGKDEADDHRIGEANAYIQSGGYHDLVYFNYESEMQMFDAHSYNKGGCILHMLRTYVGDDAFFKSLNLYLTKHAYSAAEAHQLRLAFEEVTGEDLNWFFNQWYYNAGHPILDISYKYNDVKKVVEVTIEQKQDLKKYPIFTLPIDVDVYVYGIQYTYPIVVRQAKQTFSFPAEMRPNLVNVDADKALLCRKTDNHTEEEFMYMYRNAKNYNDRFEAMSALKKKVKSNPAARDIFVAALKDPSRHLRQMAIDNLDVKPNEEAALVSSIIKLATEDPHSSVRAKAMDKLADLAESATDKSAYMTTAEKVIASEQSYRVLGTAITLLNALDNKRALAMAKSLEKETNAEILNSIADIYAATGDKQYLAFFEQALAKVDGMTKLGLMESYVALLLTADDATISKAINTFNTLAMNMNSSPWERFATANALNNIRGYYIEKKDKTKEEELTTLLKALQKAEVNSQLKAVYSSWDLD